MGNNRKNKAIVVMALVVVLLVISMFFTHSEGSDEVIFFLFLPIIPLVMMLVGINMTLNVELDKKVELRASKHVNRTVKLILIALGLTFILFFIIIILDYFYPFGFLSKFA